MSHDPEPASPRDLVIDKHKWNLRELLALTADGKGKSRAL